MFSLQFIMAVQAEVLHKRIDEAYKLRSTTKMSTVSIEPVLEEITTCVALALFSTMHQVQHDALLLEACQKAHWA